MTTKDDFQVDRCVAIAMDAMSAGQKAALKPLLRDREGFLDHASRPGMSRKLSASRPLYAMKAGPGLRIIYTRQGETITVLDVMRKVTLDRYLLEKKDKAPAPRKGKAETSVG